MNSWSSGQPKNDAKTVFSTLHPLSMVIFATATVVAFVLLHDSRFNCHCYTLAWSNAYSEISLEVHCDLSRLLVWKITKRIHSSTPALLNRPTVYAELALLLFQLLPNHCFYSVLSLSLIPSCPPSHHCLIYTLLSHFHGYFPITICGTSPFRGINRCQ